MSRDVPFDEDAICDICGDKGAFDFMGDLICPKCSEAELKKGIESGNLKSP
jgi:uncharacterized membrane protein